MQASRAGEAETVSGNVGDVAPKALPVSAPYDLALYGSKRRVPRRIGDNSSGTGSTVREDWAFRPESLRAFCNQLGSGWKCHTTGRYIP